jgi:two-component sensor histidine kinase
MAELDHRVKNTLATIQAVVRFSGRKADNITDYARSLERRIGAMAKSHSLLTTGRWTGASLRTLIEDELSSHRPPDHASMTLDGDEVDLDPKAAIALGLVLHELSTNAVKHGSLSTATGEISIRWSKIRRDQQDWLQIEWRESGGPRVAAPTRSGFGRTLLERVFAADVQGGAALEFRPEGLRCILDIPYTHVVSPAAPPTAILLPTTGVAFASLQDLRVFVVEDAALVALELCETLISHGAKIVGPCNTIEDALDLGAREAIDVGLLDIDLNGTEIWPVAELLERRGIPFLFSTGFTDASLRPPKFRQIHTINKPYDTDVLLSIMTSIALSKSARVS